MKIVKVSSDEFIVTVNQEGEGASKEYALEAKQSVIEAQQAVTDAEAQVTLAQQAVTDAESQVSLAAAQVGLAVAQVTLATAQANASIQSAAESLSSKEESVSAALSIQSSIQNLGNITGAVTIDLDLGTLILATLTGAITLSFTGLPIASRETAFSLRFTNVQSITFPVGTKFAGGAAPSALGPRYELPCTVNSSGNIIVYGSINNI